jgi:hypothetical protein
MMVVVEMIKQDTWLGKVSTKQWKHNDEAGARARVLALTKVHNLVGEQIKEEKNEAGAIEKITVDLRPLAPSPTKEQDEITELKRQIAELQERLVAVEASIDYYNSTRE